MGVIISYLFGTGRTDDPDPATGLTSRDKYLVKTSWAGVMKNPTGSGTALLILLFEKHPDYQKLFPFKDVPLKDLKGLKRFEAHANTVIYSLASVVDAIDNPDLLVPILTKIGETHFPRKVTKQMFLNLKTVAIELFSTFMKPVEVDAWKKTLDVAMKVIIQGLEASEK